MGVGRPQNSRVNWVPQRAKSFRSAESGLEAEDVRGLSPRRGYDLVHHN